MRYLASSTHKQERQRTRGLRGTLLPTTPLGFVLRFCVGNGLPLHVEGSVSPSTLKRIYVVNNVTWTPAFSFPRAGAGRLSFKCRLGGATALDPSVLVTPDCRVGGDALRHVIFPVAVAMRTVR